MNNKSNTKKVADQPRPVILYIIGEGRSGSTLLDMLLGQISGFESVGELRFVWSRGKRDNQRCGCGAAFNACDYWQSVLAGYETMNHDLTFEQLAERTVIGSMNKFPFFYMADRFFPAKKDIQSVIKSYDDLYQSISCETGSTIIIDSSKSIPFGYFLAKHSRFDVKFIHMVRDSRAVTFSRQKKKIRSEITDRVEYMPTVSSWKSSFKWLSNNFLSSIVTLKRPYIRVLYEDFVRKPQITLNAVAEFLDVPQVKFEGLVTEDNVAQMSVHHTVSGNPSRFNTGDVEIRLDDRWRKEMPNMRKRLVTFLTWPLLKYYYTK